MTPATVPVSPVFSVVFAPEAVITSEERVVVICAPGQMGSQADDAHSGASEKLSSGASAKGMGAGTPVLIEA
jgi:hypothetical protein